MSHVGTALIDPYPIFEKIDLKEGQHVADLGCGRTGHFVFSAARRVGSKGIVYAVDVMKDVLENIKGRVRGEGYDNVLPIWSDIECLGKAPIPDKSIDVCFFVNVMFLVKDKISALTEAARMLKQNGTLVIVDWAKNLGTLGPQSDKMVSIQSLTDLASQTGLKIRDTFDAGLYHYCVIFTK